MRKLNQPFSEFGNSLSVTFSGVDVRTAEGKRVLSLVYGEIARFVLACRAMPSNAQLYDAKSITRPMWSANYSKLGSMEYLSVQLRGGSRKVVKQEKKEEKEDYTVLVVFHQGGSVTCFDMNTLGKGSPGKVVYKKKLSSSWTLQQAILDVQEREVGRTIQMRSDPAVGAAAVSMLKIRNGEVSLSEDYYQLMMPKNGMETVDTSQPIQSDAPPTLMIKNGLIYTGVQAFDPSSMLSVNDDVWSQPFDPITPYGYPAYIDSELRAYFSLRLGDGTNASSFADSYRGTPDESGGGEVTFSVSASGGRTDIGNAGTNEPTSVTHGWPRPVFRQADGVDTVETYLATVNWEGGDSFSNAVVTYDGTVLQDTNDVVTDIPITPVLTYCFPFQWGTSINDLHYAKATPKLIHSGYGETYIHSATFGAQEDHFLGIVQVSNGLHYLQGYMSYTQSSAFGGTLIEARFYMDGKDCTSKLAAACGCNADELEFFFMDVPLWQVQVLT